MISYYNFRMTKNKKKTTMKKYRAILMPFRRWTWGKCHLTARTMNPIHRREWADHRPTGLLTSFRYCARWPYTPEGNACDRRIRNPVKISDDVQTLAQPGLKSLGGDWLKIFTTTSKCSCMQVKKCKSFATFTLRKYQIDISINYPLT